MMLDVMEERIIENGGHLLPVPLMTLIAASNEMPADDSSTAAALRDRFALRYTIRPIQDPLAWQRWMTTCAEPKTAVAALPQRMTPDQIRDLQSAASRVDAQAVIPLLVALRDSLQDQGILLSDRRWKNLLTVVKAEAVASGPAAGDR